MSWSASDADGCTASGAWSGTRSTTGSESVGPLSIGATFSLTCSGAGGSAIQMISVSVTGPVQLSWVAPSENVDGSQLIDLAGYRIYFGDSSRAYSDMVELSDAAATNHILTLASGDYFVAMTALDAEGNEILNGHLPLRDAFFSPELIVEDGIEPLLRGLANQICQTVDSFLVDDVRNFLFGPPGSGGFDLAALNIQRGRDHGLPSYNDAREAFGLTRVTSYSEISQDPEIQDRLAAAYDDIGEMDVWVGGLAEDPRHKAQVGPLFAAILKQQFEALRDGDRFWYERILTRTELRQIEKTHLSDVIRRNTEIGDEIADDGFRVF